MLRLHILVEGQTEETMVRDLIGPHLTAVGWAVSLSSLVTKKTAAGYHHGGVSRWAKLRKEIAILIRSHDCVTTVIDYYGLPSDSPGMADRPAADAYQRVRHVEAAVGEAIADRRFVPHLVLHETESWVFAAAEQLADLTGDAALAADLRRVAKDAGGPELIDDGPATAPSKRLLARYPQYLKTLEGPLAVEALGLPALRESCPHLDTWLRQLEDLVQSGMPARH